MLAHQEHNTASRTNLAEHEIGIRQKDPSNSSPSIINAKLLLQDFKRGNLTKLEAAIVESLECPHPLLRTDLLVECIRQLRKAGQNEQAERLLLERGYVVSAAAWNFRRDNFSAARYNLHFGLQSPDGFCIATSSCSLCKYLAVVEEHAGNFSAAVDALVESGSLRLAQRLAREHNVHSRFELTTKLSAVDYPHSYVESMGQSVEEQARRSAARIPLYQAYRELSDYSLKGVLTRQERSQDRKFKSLSDFDAIDDRSLAEGNKILELVRKDGKSGIGTIAGDLARERGRKAQEKGSRGDAALIYAQDIGSLDQALTIATRPRSAELLAQITHRVIALSQCWLALPTGSFVKSEPRFENIYVEESCADVLFALAIAGTSAERADAPVTFKGGRKTQFDNWQEQKLLLAELLEKTGQENLVKNLREQII